MKKLIKLEKDPELYWDSQIIEDKDPSTIYIPSINMYKVGDYLYKNTYLDGYMTSVSGKVGAIIDKYYNNKLVKCLQIDNDYKENSGTKIRKKKIKTKAELINYLELFHLNDLISKINNSNDIKNLVIKSIDEEGYSLSLFMILSNYYNELLETINYLLTILHLDKGLIVTKNTDSEAIKNVKSIIGTYPNIKLQLLPDQYLISYDDYLCEFLNIKKEESLIISASEVLDLYYALIKSKNRDSTLVTISGNALIKSMVINIRIGTTLREVIDKYLEFKEEEYDTYVNGLLAGYKKNKIDEIIITKDIHTIIINKRELKAEEECINCGACYKICPVNINVLKCYKEKKYSRKCLGCGLCNYICPVNLKLKEVVKDGIYEKKNS